MADIVLARQVVHLVADGVQLSTLSAANSTIAAELQIETSKEHEYASTQPSALLVSLAHSLLPPLHPSLLSVSLVLCLSVLCFLFSVSCFLFPVSCFLFS